MRLWPGAHGGATVDRAGNAGLAPRPRSAPQPRPVNKERRASRRQALVTLSVDRRNEAPPTRPEGLTACKGCPLSD
jgi:hypothetical protein